MNAVPKPIAKLAAVMWPHADILIPICGITAALLFAYSMMHGVMEPSDTELAEAGKNKCVKQTLLAFDGRKITYNVLKDAIRDCKEKEYLIEQKNKMLGG